MLELGLLVLAGYSKKGAGNNDDGALVPIELGAGFNVISRAVISTGSEVKAGIAGWEAAHAPALNYKCRTVFSSYTYPAGRHRPAPPKKSLKLLPASVRYGGSIYCKFLSYGLLSIYYERAKIR